MDKVTTALLEALKQALGQPGEQRLFRSGKLPGVFAGRTSVNAEAAARALREGLLEVVRSEIKGKTAVEWVRLTPQGIRFLHDHESPVQALTELRDALRTTQEGVPALLAEIRRALDAVGSRLAEEVQTVAHRLDALVRRVEETLERLAAPPLSEETLRAVPWAKEALAHLDRRRDSSPAAPCPLGELFLAVKGPHGELTVADFHLGLRRLHDRGVVRLLPCEGTDGLPEPEYALLDGPVTYYYATAGNRG
jgi:DNA repair ATPase RecN